MIFANKTHNHSKIGHSSIYQNKLLEGGNLIKVLEANLLMENNKIHDNELLKMHGGIHVSYGHLELNKNEFYSSRNASFYLDLENSEVDPSLQGGHLYIGTNSSLFSRENQYMEGRSFVGGCVSVLGFAYASFDRDNFTLCSAELGGAIYGSEFNSISVKDCEFQRNVVFGGRGENIFAERFYGSVLIERTNLSSFLNSVFLDQGGDLLIEDLTLKHQKNQVHNPYELYDFHEIHDENENTTIGNSTGGHSENEAAEEQPVLSAKCAEKDENDAPVDNSKRCRRERQEEEQRRIRMESPEQIEKLLNSNNYQQYSGGFYIRNMRKISKFSKVKMEGLRAQNGGCLHVQLDQNFRELRDAYNKETYRFEELDLYGCLAKKNGGAIFVKNI